MQLLPTAPEALTPQLPNANLFRKREEWSRRDQKKHFDRNHKACDMKPIPSGTSVFVTDMKCHGKVIERAKTPRSYLVDTPQAVLRRNRSQLKISPHEQLNHDQGKPTPMLIHSRPKRIKMLSLKARENLGLSKAGIVRDVLDILLTKKGRCGDSSY